MERTRRHELERSHTQGQSAGDGGCTADPEPGQSSMKLGHVARDGSKASANASKRKAMDYGLIQENHSNLKMDPYRYRILFLRRPLRSNGNTCSGRSTLRRCPIWTHAGAAHWHVSSGRSSPQQSPAANDDTYATASLNLPTRSPPRPAVAAQPAALRRRRLLKPRRQGPSKGWPGSRAIVHRSVHQLHDNRRNGLLYRFPVHRGFGSRRRRRCVHGRHGVNRRRRRRGWFGGGRRVLPLKQSNGGYHAADSITTVIQIQSSRILGRRARSEMK